MVKSVVDVTITLTLDIYEVHAILEAIGDYGYFSSEKVYQAAGRIYKEIESMPHKAMKMPSRCDDCDCLDTGSDCSYADEDIKTNPPVGKTPAT